MLHQQGRRNRGGNANARKGRGSEGTECEQTPTSEVYPHSFQAGTALPYLGGCDNQIPNIRFGLRYKGLLLQRLCDPHRWRGPSNKIAGAQRADSSVCRTSRRN
eukprot:3074300-Prymnesium_polylepis.1